MNKTLKKTLSIILTFLMIATTVPFAFAADCVHDYSGEHFCLGYYCGNCNSYYGEPNPNGHYWFGEQCGICYEIHEHRGNAGTICMGTLCELCHYPYGEVTDPDAHKWNSDGTCGYCEAECEHPSYTDGLCDDCGYACLHEGQSGSCKNCGENLGKLVIDVTDKSYVSIGSSNYDEDGIVLTGSSSGTVYVGQACNLILRNVTISLLDALAPDGSVVSIAFEGANEVADRVGLYKEHLVFEGSDTATLKASRLYNGGNSDSTVTLNGGNMVLETVSEGQFTIRCGKFIINDGTVTASNDSENVVASPVTLNGGTLNVISTSGENEAISDDITMDKGALLTVSGTYGLISKDYGNILKADGLTESDYFFVRFDTDSDFAPVSDIKAALEGKTYAEIKVDTHEHDFDNSGKCICGYACPHENVTDGKCEDCGAEGTFVTITMNDSYGDSWNGNAIKIEQLIDGVYTEVATATIEDGASETYTAVLPKDGVYAFRWVSGSYSEECSFTVTVDGEIVYEALYGSHLADGQVFYVICEHTGGTQTCKGFKCEVCMQWYGETGEHTAEGEQTCIGTLCSVCGEWYGEAGEQHDLSTEQTCMGYKCNLCYGYFGEASEHDLSSEQTCLGYYCYSCDEYYGEADPDAHRWNDTYCYICEEEHDHTGGTQTCRGYKCDICGGWYGEAREQHDLSTEQTCKGYRCNWCYNYFGEKGEHVPDTKQTCKGYGCKYCYEWFGEADLSKHSWYYGYCDYCGIEHPVDEECTHDLDDDGECRTCGYECPHEKLENGACTSCSYVLPFSLITGETITYHGSFPDAFDKAQDGSIIKLLKNYADYNHVEINKAITLDLNGKEWIQPSSGAFDVTANATFTDSVGGGYLDYGLSLYSPVTLSGGTYKYIGILFETEDTIGDYLADCFACFDHYTDELIDVTGEYVLGATIKANHNLGEQTCKGYKCEDCGEWFGEVDPDAHEWKFGKCIICEYVCEHSFTNYTETKAPTCTEEGREDSPCDYCDAMDYNTIPELNHKDTLVPVEAKAKTCTEIGWDAYEYCTACDYSTYVEIPASHEIKTVDKKDATCTEVGYEAYEYCTECDYTTYKEISSNGHTPLEAVKENEVAPKCGVVGSYDLVVYCDVCGEELDRDTTTVDALTHTDADGDYLCDNGCGHEFEKPVDPTPDEPDTPDEPTDGDCDHLCHKTGFMGFIWKIVNFFFRLFNIQQYCDCGALHYEKAILG